MATLNLNKKKFIDEENLKQIVKIGINFGERLNSIETSLIAEYDSTKTYIIGEACYHDNYIYKCNSTATGTWNPDRWTLIGDDITELTKADVEAMLGLTTEEIDTLSKIILDSEVRLDKTYSSSKIYSSIQDALDTSKAYTLAELGKISGASYKVVTATSDMTDERIIYLLDNGTTFDMYIVESGTPTKIGDTNIDLSGYLKIDEANNIYLKKTDATSTYATKVELVDKVDKTSIATTIDENSTDSQVPSAKGVYNAIYNLVGLDKNTNVLTIKRQDEELEGGEIHLETPIKGCDLIGNIVIDSYNNYLRFFEGAGTHRGCQINISNMKPGGSSFICTTNVADVPKTKVTLSDGIGGEVTYCVVNGICYVKGWGVYTNTIPSYTLPICNLPKCGLSQYSRAIYNGEDNKDNANINSFYIDDNSTILYGHFVSNKTSWFSFSYPVQES